MLCDSLLIRLYQNPLYMLAFLWIKVYNTKQVLLMLDVKKRVLL